MVVILKGRWFDHRRLTREQKAGLALYCAQVDMQMHGVIEEVSARLADENGFIDDVDLYKIEIEKAAMAVLAPNGPS